MKIITICYIVLSDVAVYDLSVCLDIQGIFSDLIRLSYLTV